MAETSSLLNCRTGSRTGGSNPPPSARGVSRALERSVHLTVRIQDSQSWHKGSIPLPTTKREQQKESPHQTLFCYLAVIYNCTQNTLLLQSNKYQDNFNNNSEYFNIGIPAWEPRSVKSLSPLMISGSDESNLQVSVEQNLHCPFLTALTSAEISSSVICGIFGQELTNRSTDVRRLRIVQPIRSANVLINAVSCVGIDNTKSSMNSSPFLFAAKIHTFSETSKSSKENQSKTT